MVEERSRDRFLALCTGALLGCSSASITWADATLDGSMGSTGSFSGNFTIPDTVGKTVGSNLFHSFSDFSINTGESATFTGPGAIDNVVSRVTGNSPSTFNGPLTSAIPSANFYFVNPNGVLFKEGARISVDGSFYATTSDFVGLGQDGIFYADPGAQSVLTSSPPSSFGFLDSNPGQIALEGSQLVKFFTLNQPNGATLSLVGGDISIDQAPQGTATFFGTDTSRGSFLSSTGGRVEMVSVGSPGEAIPGDGTYELGSFSTLGNIEIANGSAVDATEVYIRGGQVVVNESVIAPGFFFVVDMAPPPNGGSVDIAGTERVDIEGTGAPLEIVVNVPPGPAGPGGPVVVTRFDGGPLFTGVSTFGGNPFPNEPPSDVPDVQIAGGDVTLSGAAGLISQRFGPGEAGDITVKGDTVEIRDGSLIVNLNTYAGAGGDITVDANQVILDSEGNTTPVTGLTGLTASSNFSPVFGDPSLDPNFDGSGPPNPFLIYSPDLASADAGNVTVNATGPGGLTVRGADITTESRSYGQAGNITVNASDILLSREGSDTGSIATQSGFAGNAGQIEVNATGNIELMDGYVISASISGTGAGGKVEVTAGNAITITGNNNGAGSSGIASATILPPPELEEQLASLYGFPDFQTMAMVFTGNPEADMFDVLGALEMRGLVDLGGADPIAGDAGIASVIASSLNISGDHTISSSTTSDGNGGAIDIQVGSLTLEDGAEIRSRSGLTEPVTEELLVGAGNGGVINIEVDGTAKITGQAADGSPSSISTSTLGEGNGGNISLAANKVALNNGGSISASSAGTGLAGDIFINAGNRFDSNGGRVTTQATVSDGGNIQITARERVYLDKAEITTSVESGFGGGGNIDIDPRFVILNQSKILANAFGGPGGNINIVAGNFIVSPDSVIDASSELGVDGTVNISSPDEEVAEDLAVLSDSYLDVTGLVSERCGTTAGASSLVDAGPGGLAVDPDGYLPSFATATNQKYAATGGSRSVRSGERWWGPDADQAALQIAQLTCIN